MNASCPVLCALTISSALLGSLLPAQTTTYSLQIGGPGTQGSEGGDPPVLSDGSNATAIIDFDYDSDAQILTVAVTNTTPQTPGENNPVIDAVYFNLPRHTDVSVLLTSQTAEGGLPPNFVQIVDADPTTNPNFNKADGFGAFSIGLYSISGVYGNIANAEASQWSVPAENLVLGKTTFVFAVSGNDAAHLEAHSFALGPSSIPPGVRIASGVLKFQAGGLNGDGSAFIGTTADCAPGLWYAGEPCVGESLQFGLGSGPGCIGCLMLSPDPTPMPFFGMFEIPISPPYRVIWAGITAESGQQVVLNIPPTPSLEGFEGYATLAQLNGDLSSVVFSPVVSFIVCK